MTKLGLITARGGSKGIPKKNIKTLFGKPLIEWTINAAKKSKIIDRIIVSTDDEEIAEISYSCGAEIPFLRPEELSNDKASSIDTVLHCLNNIEEVEDVFLLQPTSPFRNSIDIDKIYELRQTTHAETSVSVSLASTHPEWMYVIHNRKMKNYTKKTKTLRRQDLEEVYQLNGAIYLASKQHLVSKKSFIDENTVPYIMPKERSLDIDTMLDWDIAELMASNFLSIN
tara:strand:- start:2427 stop:3107 length:681 start_codon:yes stop_codon:yes gene_type:complete